MNAQTSRADERLMDMIDKSGNEALSLLAAEVVDLKENAKDNNRAVAKRDKAMMKELKSICNKLDLAEERRSVIADDVKENKGEIVKNAEAITDMKIKDVKAVALITGISGFFGGGIVALISYLTNSV
jgi:hypothetical protein